MSTAPIYLPVNLNYPLPLTRPRSMHSHLPIRHVIQSAQNLRQNGLGQPAIPEPLVQFVHEICHLFEPFGGVARAGYECAYGDDRWEIAVFLGEREAIGGPLDGKTTPVNFRMDLDALRSAFESVERFAWNTLPDALEELEMTRYESFLTVEGTAAGQPVSLQVLSLAPDALGPAILEYQDGRVELA